MASAAIFSQACDPGPAGTGSAIDANGDGVADDLGAKTLDLDKDGKPDQIDLNGDGKFAVGLDTNGDGVLDAEGLDMNGDGIIDAIDTNGDGVPDKTSNLGTGGSSGSGGGFNLTGGSGNGTGGADPNGQPQTCDEAAKGRTYVGCEFWPTVTYNPLYTDFDFAVVLANGGTADASVTVTGPNSVNITETVPAGGLKAITLPWVSELKGPEFSRTNTSGGRATSSVRKDGGAYKVVSTLPVTAWQFNPLQFKKSGIANCAGSSFGTADCFSVSNDASLLVPATAMTGNYRVFTRSGKNAGDWGSAPGAFAITATAASTLVKVQLGPKCAAGVNSGTGMCVAAGTGVTAAKAGDVLEFTMNAGDVIELIGALGADQSGGAASDNADLSGSVVVADKPVQVIGFNPISTIPDATVGNADHIEELMLPGEVLGKSYIVAPPTNPAGIVKGGHVVRIYGNVDGTTLTYENKPAGAPDTINAGDVFEIAMTTASFKVDGSQPFAVGSFMLGGGKQGDGSCPDYPCSGDPSFSMEVAPEQFRNQYTFLAPNDYDTNFADILVPDGAVVTLDGAAVTASEAVATGWKLARVPLPKTGDGSHQLVSDKPVGLQVMGFGHATSYYYPGGLNLKLISKPPVIIIK